MEDSSESKNDDADKELGASNSSLDLKRLKPPNKKRHEDEIEAIQNSIKEKEGILRDLTEVNLGSQLKATRAEKIAVIDKLKKFDIDIRSLSQQITKKKGEQDKLNSRLHYRSEDRIDEAIRKLKWQLQAQNFKLSEEKKIVAEIDSLNRSKKDLINFLVTKKEVDGFRDKQRRMREERDRYQKNVNQLRNKEDDLKKQYDEKKVKIGVLKKEIDKLYRHKRRMIQDYRQLEKEYIEVKDEMRKQKKQNSFKRKEESKSHMEAFQNDLEEFGVQREPYEDEIKLCNTLINYLNKFQTNEEEDVEEVSKNPGAVVDELEGGKYILLKKTEDNDYSSIRPTKRRPSKKGKKFSVTKPITHAPQIFSQFASLMLNAPSTMPEIEVSLEQLQARKKFYEDGGPRVVTPNTEDNMSSSEAGISATESALCGMSRQASNTESAENPEVSNFVLDELVNLSCNDDNMSDKSEDTLARSNSDSTERTNSEADHSETSGSSQADQESRKGSDVSEMENLVFPSLSQKKIVNNMTQPDDCKPNIPQPSHSHLTPPEVTSKSMVDNETDEQSMIDNTKQSKSICTENDKFSNTDNCDSSIPTENCSGPLKAGVLSLSLHENGQNYVNHDKSHLNADIMTNSENNGTNNLLLTSICNIDDIQSPENLDTTHIDTNTVRQSKIQETETGTSMQGSSGRNLDQDHSNLCSVGNSYVVIDDNSNIHDNKQSSSDNGLEEGSNVVYSTHL